MITPRFIDLLIDPVECIVGLKENGEDEIMHKGNSRWNEMADSHKIVQLEANDACCCPGAPYWLLCPDSWEQHRDEILAEDN